MTYTRHFCEICDKSYEKLEEATICEAKGIFGFEIKPGLILKSNNHPIKNVTKYLLFSRDSKSNEGHYKRQLIFQFHLNDDNKKIPFIFRLTSNKGIDANWHSFKEIISYLSEGYWEFIKNEEIFDKVKEGIIKSKNKDLSNLIEKYYKSKEFYNYHEKLDYCAREITKNNKGNYDFSRLFV